MDFRDAQSELDDLVAMKTLLTSTGSAVGQLEIQFELEDPIAPSGTWFLDYLNHEIRNGVRFQAGETVQIGWMLAMLDGNTQDDGSSCLELREPDFKSIPIQWQRGLNQTFRHLVLQKSVCEALKCEPVFPEVRFAGIVSPSFFGGKQFAMWREETEGADSGWMFDLLTGDRNEGQFQSLYQIVLEKPEVIPFLALPAGSLITWDETQVCVEYDGRQISSRDDVMLGCWFERDG